jgi:hypothetical protein
LYHTGRNRGRLPKGNRQAERVREQGAEMIIWSSLLETGSNKRLEELHNEENLRSCIRVTKARNMRRAGHVPRRER